MHNYIDRLTCIAMMNKNCNVDENDKLMFYKNKARTKIVVCNNQLVDKSKFKDISFMYLDEDPKIKGSYKMDEIVSILSRDMFIPNDRDSRILNGKRFIELRGTVNKWSRFLNSGIFRSEKLSCENLQNVLDMIEKWRYLENGGMKYMWQERAGCDKAFVQRIVDNYESISNEILANVFYFNNECIGYSTIEKNCSQIVDGIQEFKYLTRKCLNRREFRNLTEYIDYWTFKNLLAENSNHLDKFLVNWGASSGGVAWYKKTKWPLYNLESKWFCKIKGELA